MMNTALVCATRGRTRRIDDVVELLVMLRHLGVEADCQRLIESYPELNPELQDCIDSLEWVETARKASK